MSRRRVVILPGVLLILCSLGGFAQAPPKTYGPPIGVKNAKKGAAVALAEAKKNNWYMAVAVVDPSGAQVYYEKMDNTQTGSATVAIAKAQQCRPVQTSNQGIRGCRCWRRRRFAGPGGAGCDPS